MSTFLKTDHWLVILNPHAGGKQAANVWPFIEQELINEEFKFDLVRTQKPKHAVKIAEQKIDEGYRKIISIGGDGTLHEIINGIMLQKTVSPLEILLGIISIGTGNDWIKTHNISDNFKIAIQQIKNGKTMLQDIGKISFKNDFDIEESRYFINSVGIGFDAEVVKYMLPKKIIGTSKKNGYMNGLINTLFTNKNILGSLHLDDETIHTKIYNLTIGVCRYKGGGFKMLPNAIPNDGKLDVTLASRISKFKLLKSLPKIFAGKVERIKYFDFYQVKNVLLEIAKPLCTEVDGEFLSYFPKEVSILPQQIRLISEYR